MADVTALVPLLVVVPLAVAVTLTATARWLPDWVPDLAAILAAAAVTAISIALLLASREHPIVYWFGGWRPVAGMPVGIAFVVEPLGAALAALAGLLTTASLVFSWRYFEDVGHLYHALVLAFLAGMVGFSLSADLFNIFVFLELMSVSAYALCGYQIHQAAVVQGAVNFAIINSLGTFTMLMGIAMVYAGTGQLNLSAIGHQLSQDPGHPPGTAVVVGFSFITVGLLVKAGAVPFHFWMSDAYAVAPAPVGALFAGVMSDLAYHTYARVYWDAFAPGFDEHAAGVIRHVLLTIAVLTALLGAVMCVLQSDLKRQIAFLTISHGGIFFAGIALLTPRGLAGATLYLITDGLLKAALFLSFAIVIKRLGGSDELALHGKGRRPLQVLPMVVFLLVGLGLATLPPFGTFLSSALIYDSPGYGWLPPLMVVAAAITSGTVLRAAARIYLGWGPTSDPLLTGREKDEPEEGEPEDDKSGLALRLRVWLLTPALGLVLVAYGVAFTPSVAEDLVSAAAAQQDPVGIEQLVLHGHRTPTPQVAGYEPSRAAFAYGSGAAGGALLLAALGLWWRRLGRRVVRPVVAAARGLKAVHDGSVGDYAVWFTAGVAVLTAAWAGLLR